MANRRTRRREQIRSALLKSAAKLFAERGINGSRIEDITESVNLGKGAFYNYFESKDALISELVGEGMSILQDDYLQRLNGEPSQHERIRLITDLHQQFFDEHRNYALLFHQVRGLMLLQGTRSESLRKLFADYLDALGEALIAPGDTNDWGRDDLQDIAAAMAGGMVGYRSFRIAAGATADTETAAVALSSGIPALMDSRRRGDES